MGYRGGRPQPVAAPGACASGSKHRGVPVETLLGETVAHICPDCLMKVKPIRPPGSNVEPWWAPYSDAGEPLPSLPMAPDMGIAKGWRWL